MTLPGLLRDLRRAAGWHRRLLAAGLAAAAVALAISALSPTAPASVAVLAATRDLPPGVTLTDADLRAVRLPPDVVPAGAQRPGAPVTGRVLAAAIRRGEPLTDVRMVGRALLTALAHSGLVAAPVRIADAASVTLLRPGDRIDVLAAGSPSGLAPDAVAEARTPAGAEVVVPGATVLTVPTSGSDGLGGEGALVLLAVQPGVATALARSAVTSRLSYTLRAS
ncbi:MAG: SAF domain-containing protein [Mycobacteriales bacterium]